MGLVTGVEIVRGGAAIYIDGTLFLRLRKADFEAFPVSEGDDLDEEEYTDRLCAHQSKAAYEAALTALDRRDMTASGMRALLRRKGFLPAVAEAVAGRLVENRLIDDRRYAAQYVERRKNTPTGVYALRRGLKARGIDEETAESAVGVVDEDQQLEQAKALVERLQRRYEGLPSREKKAKLSQALARRGFGWDVISAALDAEPDEDYDD